MNNFLHKKLKNSDQKKRKTKMDFSLGCKIIKMLGRRPDVLNNIMTLTKSSTTSYLNRKYHSNIFP